MNQAPIIAKMAFRNVLKYRRRSIETFAVLFVGVAAVAIADAFMNGFSDRIVADYAVASGHLRASAKGYAARRATCPLDRIVADPEALAAQAREAAFGAYAGRGPGEMPFTEVVAAPRIRAACALQLGTRSTNVYAAGADAYSTGAGGSSLAMAFRSARLLEGRFPAAGEAGMLLSEKTASRLGARLGDRVIALAGNAYGSFGAVELPLVGVTSGDPGPEPCLLDLASMRKLVGIETGATEVPIYLVDSRGASVDPRSAPQAIAAIASRLEASGLEAEAWNEGSSSLSAMLKFFDIFAYVVYAIFAVVAGSGIANSVLLSIQDRTRDFATLRAVAFGRGAVEAIVALEVAIIGAAASIAAAAASAAFIALLGPEGLVLPEATRGIAEWIPRSIAARTDLASLAFILAGGVALPLAAAAYPLHALGKMNIREALGYV